MRGYCEIQIVEVVRTSKVMKRIRLRAREGKCLAIDDGVDCPCVANGNLGLCRKHQKRHERALERLSRKEAKIYLQEALRRGIVLQAQEIRDFKPGNGFSSLALEARDIAHCVSETV